MGNSVKWMREALKEAHKAKMLDEVPVGAVVVFNNEIIAKAHNLKESSQISTKHAEIIAIEKANEKLKSWRLNECELYVTMEPCLMCVGAIIQARIKKVVYGCKDLKFGAIESVISAFDNKAWNHHPEIEKNVLAEECSNIVKDFFYQKRNK
ncbi:MAG: tRNA adenosine(34) deaminase TadA [Erysipelotrichaceae bacterium]